MVSAKMLSLALAATTAIGTSLILLGHDAEAKTPGSTYCFYGTCHRVKSIAETEALIGADTTLQSSFYDDCSADRYNPCGLTSSGERFRPEMPDNAASPIYPDGTELLVWSPATGDALVLRVNNAGPYWGDRKLDVSRAAAEQLGFKGSGVARLMVRIIDAPTRGEATYLRERKYAPVPGYIGRYASIDDAAASLASMMAIDALATAVRRPLKDAVTTARAELVSSSRTVMLAKADTVPPPAASPKSARKDRIETAAATGVPIIDEIVQLTDNLLGIAPKAAPKAKVRHEPRAKRATVVASAEPARRTKARAATAAVSKAPAPAAKIKLASLAKPAPKIVASSRPVTADPPVDMSVFSLHAKSVKPQATRQAENVQRVRKPG